RRRGCCAGAAVVRRGRGVRPRLRRARAPRGARPRPHGCGSRLRRPPLPGRDRSLAARREPGRPGAGAGAVRRRVLRGGRSARSRAAPGRRRDRAGLVDLARTAPCGVAGRSSQALLADVLHGAVPRRVLDRERAPDARDPHAGAASRRGAPLSALDVLAGAGMTRIVRILAPNPGIRELEGTNTWIVGDRPAVVIDPGPDDERHLREVVREAGRVSAILLTHDHPDHAPGARTLGAMTGATVLAARPPEGAERLRDGQEIAVRGGTIRCVATPGHSADHMAFFLQPDASLFTGDAVLGRGTSVIDLPEGDLVAYLRSLRRMRELEPRTIHPGHGPLVLDAVGKLDEYLDHRARREEQVLAALGEGSATPEEMVPAIYGDY